MKNGSNTDNTSIHSRIECVLDVCSAAQESLSVMPMALNLIRVSSVFHPWLNASDSIFFQTLARLFHASAFHTASLIGGSLIPAAAITSAMSQPCWALERRAISGMLFHAVSINRLGGPSGRGKSA